MDRKLFFDVLGVHVLALWLLSKEIHPDDPASVAKRVLRAASTAYCETPSEQMEAITEAISPKNWPPDESD